MSNRDLAPGVDSFNVHIGLWTNWAQGKVYGATLTTTKQNGNLLIAFLALFVAAAGKSFWRLTCLALHRSLSSREPRDALHHQRQVVLRNSETPEFALWNFILMLKAWRNKAARPITRLLFYIVLSLAIFAAYNAASLFSSRVTNDTASEVLLTGKDCRAPFKPATMDGTTFRTMYDIWGFRQNTAVLNYAQKCYMNLDNEQDCRHYVKSKLPMHITRNTSCPFDAKMCKTGAIIVDTGHLNSNTDLGINMPPRQQFTFRSVNHCAPIISKGYTYIHNQTRLPDIPLIRYQYGNYTSFVNGSAATKDFVYQVATNNISYAYFEGTDLQVRRNARYDVRAVTYHSGDVTQSVGVKTMSLIPELSVPESDIHLFFLSAEGLFYLAEIHDPWYSAHHIGKTAMSSEGLTNGSPKSKPVNFYAQDEPASVLACKSQFQICDAAANGAGCSPLAGWNDVQNGFDALWGGESDARKSAMEWIYLIMQQGFISPDAILDIAGQTALSAAYGLGYSINGPLPNNTWENEVLLWHSASAASLQALFVDFANGPATLPAAISAAPETPEGRAFCVNQRILSTRYASFSVLGMAIIFVLGGALIVLDLALEGLLDWAQRNKSEHDYARLEWKANATLQLHRLAHEGADAASEKDEPSVFWTQATDAVPTTRSAQPLHPLNIADIMHPRLVPGSRVGGRVQLVSSLERAFTGEGGQEKEEEKGVRCEEKAVSRKDSEQTLAGERRESVPSEPLPSPLRREILFCEEREDSVPSPVPGEVETAYGVVRR